MINKNFQAVLERNKDFIESIKKLLEKNISKERSQKRVYEEVDSFKKDLVNGKLMKCFSKVNINSIDSASVSLEDKQGTTWTFAIDSKIIELIEVSRMYILHKADRRKSKTFFVKHTPEKSFVEESMWNSTAQPLNVEFKGTSLTTEDIDFIKIVNDFDLSFLSYINLEGFHLNRKNKTIFQQNYEKNFGDKSYLFRNKR